MSKECPLDYNAAMLLRTLGALELTGSSFTRPKPLMLLAHLALEGPKERRHLAELFWQGATDPFNRLAVTLARLRKADPNILGANNARIWTDLATDAQALLTAIEGGRLKEAVGLYQGPFLEGVYFDDWGRELADWAYDTRDFLASQTKTAQLVLAEAEAGQGKFHAAAKRAEAAYSVAQTAGFEPSDIKRLHTLLLAGDSPRTATFQGEAETFGVKLLTSSNEARDALRHVFEVGRDIPSNLPGRGNTFVGRDLELAHLAGMLADPDQRLVTVVGPAGVGKTRLALEAARQQLRLGRFKDGVYFVTLDALTSASLIPSSLAGALGLTLQGQGEPFAQITRHLGNRYLLLVLDNFEHLLEGATLTSDLLHSCPNLKLLTTSRERLNVEEEWVFIVEGLSHPKEAAGVIEESEYFDAPQLFLQRARQARPDFGLHSFDLSLVLKICRLVNGLPLGLELAATWVKAMSLADIAQEIGRSLDALTTTTRNVPKRHKSIRAAFEHSWKLLTPKEQDVLGRLSVFRGGFRREAASEVAKATIPLLVALVDKSMLQVSHDGRYDFHPLLYRYTGEKLNANPNEQNLTWERHAAYFFALAKEAGPRLHDAEQTNWLGRLEEELGNLRAALAWAEEHHQPARGLQLAVTLGEFCRTRGFLTEGRTLLHSALTQPGAAERIQVRARALTCAGTLAWMQSVYAPATSFHEESLAISRELGDKEGIAASLHHLGWVKVEQGDYRLSRSLFEESLAIDRGLESWCGVAHTLYGLGWVVLGEGDVPLARSLYEESLALGRKIGNRLRMSDALHGVGLVMSCQGDLPLARRFYGESLAISRELGDKWSMVNTLNRQGLLMIEQGDYSSALSLLEESMMTAREIGDSWGIILTLESFASLAAATGNFGRTARLWGAAEALRERLGSPLPPNDRSRHKRDLAAARVQLKEAAYQAERAAGRALNRDQAIAYSQTVLEVPST